MAQVSPRFEVVIVQDRDTSRRFLVEYIVQIAERWSFTDESDAEGIRRLLVSIERNGPRGQVVRSGVTELYEATYNVHRIAHAQDPDDPKTVYALLAYLEKDAEQGRAKAWCLLLRALGLIT